MPPPLPPPTRCLYRESRWQEEAGIEICTHNFTRVGNLTKEGESKSKRAMVGWEEGAGKMG